MANEGRNLLEYLRIKKNIVDGFLKKYFRQKKNFPEALREAMEYSVLAGGKRLRPILCLASAEACLGSGRKTTALLSVAAALEMIHTYSLIHDDLPAMDNDDYRRGKLTCHKKFGEALAILAGDALLTEAFGILGKYGGEKIVALLSQAAGAGGMIAGQVGDMLHTAKKLKSLKETVVQLEYIHRHKTADLIKASCLAGAILAEASAQEARALANYGENIGLAFQIMDDVLDLIGDKKKLGKKGSDQQNQKLTYARVYSIEESLAKARRLTAEAKQKISRLKRKDILTELADYVVQREY
ncbi:MAG: polyprenyl synthetase family protein [Elusimicrobiota bacterium]